MVDKLVTIKEASQFTGIPSETIRYHIKKGRLQCVEANVKKVYLSEVDELKTFDIAQNIWGDIILDPDDSLRPLDCFSSVNPIANPLRFKTSPRYMVSKNGRIFNLERNTELKQSEATHGYMQVAIAQYGVKRYCRVQTLVGYVWLPNPKGRNEIHHVDGNKKNNRKENLLRVFNIEGNREHDELDAMLKEAKRTNDFTAYNKRVQQVREDSESDEAIDCILELKEDGNFYFLYITREAHIDLKNGKYDIEHIPPSEIRGEFAASDDYIFQKEDETQRLRGVNQ